MNRHMRTYYVYILASNRNGTLYVGVTNTLPRRVEEHKRMINKGFTARYKVRKLVWFQGFHRVQDAIATEKKIKHWNRAWKLQLIDSFNHEWRDLSEPVVEAEKTGFPVNSPQRTASRFAGDPESRE